MDNDALEVVRSRSTFYRDNFRKLALLLVIMAVANVALMSLVLYVYNDKPRPEYFATDQSGRVTKLLPLSDPMFSTSAVLQWANEAAVAAYTYNFVDYRKQLQQASEYFTGVGWKNFEAALKKSRNLETVIDKKLVVTAVATGAPVVLNRGVINGHYAWKVQMPLLVTYQSSGTDFQQPIVVTLVITRVPVLNEPKGIAITQFVAAQSS